MSSEFQGEFGGSLCPTCGGTGRISTDVPGRAGPLVTFCSCPVGQKVSAETFPESDSWIEASPYDPDWVANNAVTWTPRQVEAEFRAQEEELVRNRGWISVKKRRPDHPGHEVLATDGPHCYVAIFDRAWWCQQSGQQLRDITHWRPLPPVPPDEPEQPTVPYPCSACNRTLDCSCDPDDVKVAGHYHACDCFQHRQHCPGTNL